MCQKIKLEQSKVDTILPDQLRQFVFGILWDVAKEVDCSLGLCGSERVGTGKLGDIIVGLAAQSHDQAQPHWIIIFGHMLATLQAQRKKTTIRNYILFGMASRPATPCSLERPLRHKNSNWNTRLKQLGRRRTPAFNVTPGQSRKGNINREPTGKVTL